jgi:hypothetical protein
MRAVEYLKRESWMLCGVFAFVMPMHAIAQVPDENPPPLSVEADASEALSAESESVEIDSIESGAAESGAAEGEPTEIGSIEIGSMEIGSAGLEDAPEHSAPTESPLRISAAYELGYKTQQPARTIKNRSSLRLEYAKTYSGRFSVQFDGKASAFLGNDHRRAADDYDTMVTQAYVQTSIGDTSIRAGIQTLPWGESLLSPITDEVSPRDNRELFNFNLEELRIGQPMLVVDHYAHSGRWSTFFVPKASFNESPANGTLYDFDPLTYRRGVEGDNGAEYGFSWKKNYDNADITLMAASLIDNDYARRMNDDGEASRVRERFTLTGLSFTRAMGSFVLRGEAAVKFGKPFNDAALQIVRKRTVDTFLSLDYQSSPTLSFSADVLNQHVSDWDTGMIGVARNRQTLRLSAQKNFWNDDLSVTLQNFRFWPNVSNLTMLMFAWKANDNLTLNLNLAVPTTNQQDGSLWSVRDQKQTLFKIQWQF